MIAPLPLLLLTTAMSASGALSKGLQTNWTMAADAAVPQTSRARSTQMLLSLSSSTNRLVGGWV